MIVTVHGVDFETAYTRRGTMSIGQMQVPVISRDDLIKAKLRAGHRTLSTPVCSPRAASNPIRSSTPKTCEGDTPAYH
jgi:hypothetical protein